MSSRICLVSVGLMICALLSACEDETRPSPLPEGMVSGTVIDAQGRPVAGASVSLVFGIDGVGLQGWEDPAKRIETTIHFFTAEPSHVTVEVFDRMGRHVRQLIDELLSAYASKYVTVEDPTRPFAVDLRIR